MNKIYKVIWSKAKHTYVVASEIAKGHTKGETTGKGLKKLAAAMLVAAALLSPSFAWAEDTTVKVEPAATGSTTAVEVYTKKDADKQISELSTLIGNNTTNINTNTTNINGLTTRVTALETADKNSVTKVTGSDAKLTITKGDGSTSEVTIDNVNHATSADSATTAESATKATQDGNGNEISTTYATKTELSNEVSTLKAADSALDSRTSALEAKTGSLNRVAAANSTSINESMTLKGKQYSATLQVNGSGAQIGVVNNSVAGLANDGGTAYTEYRARTGAILSKATNDISSTSSNGQVVDTAGDTTGEYSQVATAKSTGTTFTYNDGTTSSSTTIKGDSVSTGTVSATAGITDGTTTNGTSVKASQTVGQNLNALDERITNVKEYVLSETVSKTDAAVQDGAIVKAANTIGDNVTKLDAALAKETAARIGADKAQDKVIQQVNQNMVEGFNTINKNMAAGFNALSTADANELAGRVAADTELVKATNGGLALNDKNVLQKNETTIENGTVTTKTTAADTLIMNEGATNQITLSKNGIKVGTNSTVIASDGVFAGGDTADKAKAALNADGSIKGADGAFTVDKSGNVTSNSTVTGKTLTDGIATLQNGNLNTTGNVNAHDIVATGDISGKAITGTSLNTQGGSISGGAITGTSLNTQGGAINGGAITGTSINGTTGTFGSLTTTSNASVGGKLTANGITNTGNVITDTLTVNHNATVGGDLGVTGDITGKSLNVGTGDIKGGRITGTGLDVGAGTIKTTGAVETGTLTTTGNATIGGNLTVDKNLKVNGEFNAETLSSRLDETNYTTINGGNVTSVNNKVDTDDGKTYTSSSKLTEKGRTDTAAVGNITNVSTQTATESKSTIENSANTDVTQKSYITQNLKNILQGIQNGTNATIVDQTETGIKSTATDGTKTASTNLSNKGFNTYATDGTNKTYTLQTAESLTSQIGDDGKVKSVMNADGITNNADGGTITNSAKDLVNKATGDMTNTVGGKLLNDVTGDMENKVGGKLTTTVTGKTTENYNGGLETTVTGEEKHTVNGNQNITVNGTKSETVTGDVTEDYQSNMTTTVGKDQKTIVKGSQTNEISGSQTNTIGGSQATTVTGDSSLTAENIKNEAKNRITNTALDVETDAKSSIVNKVSNDAGSNTSTQLSYQTTEEMSQADGKTASYLRGAAEEKSQLTDGDKKTTIDTIAGQTNTNITDGKNISNSLQNADKIASSVTDGTNTTVVNQDATSLASSITDGTKVNNTNNTVDKSEQLIKASDTQYSATTKTAAKMEDALISGSSVIDVIKSLDDAANPVISSAVTDGTNTTGSTMTAKGITNSAAESIVNEIGDGSKVKSEMTAKGITNTAKDGTITNDAKDVLNKGTNSVINEVDNNQVAVKTDSVKAAYGSDTYTTWDASGITSATSGDMKNSAKNISNTAAEKLSNSAAEIENTATKSITDKVGENTSWKMTDGTVVESVKDASGKTNQTTTTAADTYQFVKNGDNTLAKRTSSTNDNLNITDGTNTYTKITNATGNKQTVTDGTETASTNLTKSASNTLIENGTQSVLDHMAADTSYTVMNEKGNGSRRQQTASEILDRVTDGTDTSEVKQTASEVAISSKNITNTADTIKDVAGKTTVTTTDTGTTFENKAHSTAIEEGTITNTTISGNTLETGKATMDYAEVMKDLGVRGNTTVDGNTTLGKEGADTTLTVNSTSTFNKDVTMKGNATVRKNLTVEGDTSLKNTSVDGTLNVTGKSTFNDTVSITKGGLEVAGGTTTDTLHVTSTSQFDGAATFKDIVTMEKDLNVGGNVDAASYKVDGKTYIDKDGINANGHVIQNVGQGKISEGSTDAVSGGQLYETNTRVSGLETRMGTVETKVDKLDNKIDKVGANAAAMANLHPLEFDEDSKWNIAAAVGSSGSETASAVGVFYRPNENVMVNASAAMGTGENMFGGGVSLRLGHGGNKAKEAQMKAAAKENRELRAKVDDLTARMDALLSVLNPNMSKDFPDVPENHWAYEAVSRLAGNGIVEGYEDGKYHGERQMTRYEMAEIIYNALSKGAKAEKKLVEEFRPELQAMAAQKRA